MNIQSMLATRPALDESIRKTLSNTLITVGAMWLITAVVGFMTRDAQIGGGLMLGLFVASLVTIFAVHKFRNSPVGLGLLALFAALSGASLGPILARYAGMAGGTQMIATAAALTAAATFGCAMYAITSRRSFSHLGGFLFAAILVFLVASIIAVFVQSSILSLGLSVVGSLLFTVFLLYDISEVVTGQETNYISASLSIFLDMFNLFMNLLRFLGLVGSDD